ncbi:MAG: PDDEXK nuclease domain-containing protein [Candidatus Omnitrophota bacterium]|nr:PDDEXK nuclease domain-containing protein [Candidatus Omnitrophota bacterium]
MPRKSSKERPLLMGLNSYQELISKIGLSIDEGRRLAARNVNSVLVATYWSVGRWIVEFEQRGKDRAAYGEMLIERISEDLTKRYGKGWGDNQLLDIRQFYLTYRSLEKPHTVCGELETSNIALLKTQSAVIPPHTLSLSWSHYRFLMRIQDPAKRQFYEVESRQGNWSVRQLDRQIQSLLYERTSLSRRKQMVLSKDDEHSVVIRPVDEFKDPYILEFLNLKDEYSESQLEDALIHHMETFLLELGFGFSFIGRQKRFEVGGRSYYIDLLLYHRVHRCLVILDLKIGEFSHGDAGQMNFYLNWAKKEAKLPGEKDPMGIILCSGKNEVYAEYALGGMKNKILVPEYRLKFPKPDELKREIQKGRSLFLENQARRKTF